MRPTNDELRESWFGARRSAASGALVLAPERPLARTFALGAALGALGGVGALAVAGVVASHALASYLEVAAVVGRAPRASAQVGLAVGGVAGLVPGGVLALVMRHGMRFLGRAIFGVVSTAAVWFCLHVALLARHLPTLPLVPMLAGACLFGFVVALAPPSRRRA